MHSEVVLGDLRERANTFIRLVLCLLIDAALLVGWAALQVFAASYTAYGIEIGEYQYKISTNLRLVLGLGSLAPVVMLVYADAITLVRKVTGSDSVRGVNGRDLLDHLRSSDSRLPLECPPTEARDIYVRRFTVLVCVVGAVIVALIGVVSTGGTPQFGISVASLAVIIALVGNQLRQPFLAATFAFAFSLAAAAALLGTLVLFAELLGLSGNLTAIVMLAGIIVGADLLIVWRVVRTGWADREQSREDSFGKHYVLKEVGGVIAGVELDDRAPTRELVQRAYRSIRRIPATPQDAEEIRDLEIVGKKCWRKYNQILALVAQGARADINLYRQALLDEDRVVRYCEQILAETRQFGAGAAPRYRVYSGTAGRRQLKELLLAWNAALSKIIECERELGVSTRAAMAGRSQKQD